jgi:amidase
LAGYDQNDASTASSIGNTPVGYIQFLKPGSLHGARVGLLKTLPALTLFLGLTRARGR